MRSGRKRMPGGYCNALSDYFYPTPDFIEFLEADLAIRGVEPFPWKQWSPHKAELTQGLCYPMIAGIWPNREKYRQRR